MMLGPVHRVALSVAITVGGIVTACRPSPANPTPLTPEVTRQAPRPQKIDPTKHKPRKIRVSQAAQPEHDLVDAGVSDVIDLPPVPDADFGLVRDAGQPLK